MTENVKERIIRKNHKYIFQFPEGTPSEKQAEYMEKFNKTLESDDIAIIDPKIKVFKRDKLFINDAEEKKEDKAEDKKDADDKKDETKDDTKTEKNDDTNESKIKVDKVEVPPQAPPAEQGDPNLKNPLVDTGE